MGHQQPAAPSGTGSGTEDTVGQVEAGWELQEESSIEPNGCGAFGTCWSMWLASRNDLEACLFQDKQELSRVPVAKGIACKLYLWEQKSGMASLRIIWKPPSWF